MRGERKKESKKGRMERASKERGKKEEGEESGQRGREGGNKGRKPCEPGEGRATNITREDKESFHKACYLEQLGSYNLDRERNRRLSMAQGEGQKEQDTFRKLPAVLGGWNL